jgi:hypothetical protein
MVRLRISQMYDCTVGEGRAAELRNKYRDSDDSRSFQLPLQLNHSSPMSQTPIPASSSNFRSIFDTALNQYKKKTKNNLVAHQLTAPLESCTSPSAILAVLDEQYHVQQFIQSRNDNERPKPWLNATANVICAFSATTSGAFELVCKTSSDHLHASSIFQMFSPVNVIFTGVGVFIAVGDPYNS